MDLSLFFAGTAGSVPTARRGLPALLLRRGGDRLLFDCGEGTQRQLLRIVGLPDIDATSSSRTSTPTTGSACRGCSSPSTCATATRRSTVYGPPGTARAACARCAASTAACATRSRSSSSSRGEAVEFDGYEIERVQRPPPRRAPSATRSSRTRGPAASTPSSRSELGVAVRPRLRPPAARRDRRRRARPSRSSARARPGRRIVISGDTAPCDMVRAPRRRRRRARARGDVHRRGARARALETGHCTARQAAEIAREADVRLLALTHLSTRYGGARSATRRAPSSQRTVVPRDFDAIEVPFPRRASRS